MRKSILTLLALITLLSQWGWLEHAYHEHDSDGVCNICLTGHVYDHTITQPSLHLPNDLADCTAVSGGQPMLTMGSTGHYSIRAPPILSHTPI